MKNLTQGKLQRFVVRFPSTHEAENFREAIGYVYRFEPIERRDIGKVLDGRTVIVYVFSHYWTQTSLAKEAALRGGKIVGKGRVNPGSPSAEYEKTHWGEKGKGRASRSSAPDPCAGDLIELGELTEICYRTKKGGDTERVDYEHKFKSPRPRLCYNETGLVICGGTYTITERGIVG